MSKLITYQLWFLNQSGASILIGFVTSYILLETQGHKLNQSMKFSENYFSYLFLPLILFSDGYTIQKRKILRNIVQIVAYGLIGTMLNFTILYFLNDFLLPESDFPEKNFILVICLMSIKSVTSIVIVHHDVFHDKASDAFGFVLGESLMNDLITLLIFRYASADLVSAQFSGNELTSTSVFQDLSLWFPSNSHGEWRNGIYLETIAAIFFGIICSFLGSLLMKLYRWIQKDKPDPNIESILVVCFAQLVYSITEYKGFNGPCVIVTYALFFKHYGWYNLSIKGIIMTEGLVKNLCVLSEYIMFIFLGLNLNMITEGHIQLWYLWDWKWYILMEFGLLACSRLLIILIISALNYLYIQYFHFYASSVIKKCCLKKDHGCLKNQQIADNSLIMFIMWASGLFKGIIAFTMALRYEELVEEYKPLEHSYGSDVQRFEADFERKQTLYIVYGLVIFTNIIWGGILPKLLKFAQKEKEKDAEELQKTHTELRYKEDHEQELQNYMSFRGPKEVDGCFQQLDHKLKQCLIDHHIRCSKMEEYEKRRQLQEHEKSLEINVSSQETIDQHREEKRNKHMEMELHEVKKEDWKYKEKE